MQEGERRLAAIMYTDIVGFTSLTQKDESSTLQALEKHRSLLRPIFSSHGGREVKTMGDAFLIEFQSALDAVLCGVAVQQMMHDRKVARGETISLRVGIHVGDVIERDNDILGDAVNIASRIEPLAEPGGICISSEVYNHVRNKSDIHFVSLGGKSLKNVNAPVEVFKAVMPWDRTASLDAPSYPSNRIAILPFVSMSTSPDDAFFADGVTEEIISTVSGISGLDVISRTSVMGYKGTTKKVEDIGRELKVGSVLEGSFRKAGNRIRVTTQLIDVAGDRHLWSQNYDRTLDDVFEVQSDVAKQVADALRVKILTPEKERIERKPTESTLAYTLYLKGRSLWNKRGLEDLKKALEYFELAVHEDPSFALGYVGQADCCIILCINWGIECEANREKAKRLVARALELDPGLAEAHTSRANMLFQDFDPRQAEDEFRRALEQKPGYATAHMWYSMLLRCERRWDEEREEIEKAAELDPLSPIIEDNRGDYCRHMKDYSGAIEHYGKAVDLGYASGHLDLAQTYGRMKRFDDMKRELETWSELVKDSFPVAKLYSDAFVAYFMGDKKTVARLLPEFVTHFHDTGEPRALDIGALYVYLGKNDEGFEWLERSYQRREFGLVFINCDQYTYFDGVRDDPRYLDLVKKLGLEPPN